MNYIAYYRMWLPDIVEPEGGTWCYMGMDEDGYMYQLNFNYKDKDDLDTYDTYIEWGYKIEKL